MASEPINREIDTEFVVVRMGGKLEVVTMLSIEVEAKKKAEELANKEQLPFAVYQKIGTASAVRKVEWKGRNG